MKDFAFDLQRFDNITNSTDYTSISGTSGADTIYNDGDNVSINAGDGNDSVKNNGDYSTINCGSGNDSVWNTQYIGEGDNSSINLGSGNDIIHNFGDGVTIVGGKGDDSIGNNYYLSDGSNFNSTAGKDVLFKYTEGDGNDLIGGFRADSTLSISGGSYSSQTSGSDIIVTVGNGKITLVGAASLSTVNIDGTEADSKLIRGTEGADSINNSLEGATIQALGGNDYIYNGNYLESVSIDGGSGDDTIKSFSRYVTINGGDGNDSIYSSWSRYVSLTGGAGNDTLYVSSDGDKTLTGGSGSDLFRLYYDSDSAYGTDVITDYAEGEIISIGGVAVSSIITSGNNVIIAAGNNSLRVNNAAGKVITYIDSDGTQKTYDEVSKLIRGTEGADSINNSLEGATIEALGGNDTIFNSYYDSVSIDAGAGDDSVYTTDNYVTINGGDGSDTIENYGRYVTINAGDGADYIYSGWTRYVSLTGGAGNDTLYVSSDGYNTLTGGTGSDLFWVYYDSDTIYGTDVITDYAEEDTIQIGGVAVSSIITSGNNVIIAAGNNSLRVNNAAGKVITYIDSDGTQKTYGEVSKLIRGTSGADYINNSLEGATIQALGGSDTIYSGDDYNSVSIDAGAGNDSVYTAGNYITINGGDGKDTIRGYYGDYSIFNAGAGNDKIFDDGSAYLSINAGAGADLISLKSVSGFTYSHTIKGGTGNDTIYSNSLASANSGGSTYQYSSGDGNDKIIGFTAYDTLQIGGGNGSYSSQQSGSNIIVTVGKGKISLMGAASLSAVNIDGVEEVVETNAWKLDGTTATYGTTNNTLIKITNVKSLDGLSLSGNVVTVDSKSVNGKKITLTGSGYTLALADDVTKRETKPAAWSYSNGTATYKGSYKTKGYLLSSNAKSISYYSTATTASTLATVKGVKSLDGLSLSRNVVTVDSKSVNGKKITLTGSGYILALADDVTKRETKPAAWSYSNGTATYKGSYKTKGYLLSNNAKSISYYSTATTASTLASVKGAASTSGLTVSGSKITLKKSALKNKVTVSGGYEFDFASGYSTATITGTAKADTITARGTNISINAGKGDDTIKLFGKATITGGDGADTFIYNKGNDVIADYAAADTISIASGTAATSTSGKDLILTVGTGTITVTGGTGSTVTYFDDGGKHTYQKAPDPLEGVNVTKSGKVVTLTDDYSEDAFNAADLSKYKNKIITINAVKVPRGLEITANANSNSITGTNDDDKIYGLNGADTIRGGKGSDYIEGGKGADEIYGGTGSDTLWGGAGDDILAGGNGNDVFIYGNDDGHDIITDYADIDRIMILSGEKPTLAYTPLSNNMTFNIGSGSIVIENPQGQNINFIKSDGSYLHHEAVIRSAK